LLSNSIHEEFAKAAEHFGLEVFEGFNAEFEKLVHQALDRTGKWHQRDCPLKAPLMIYFTVMMALNRSDSMSNIFKIMVNKLRNSDFDLPLKPIKVNTLIKARLRLGPNPLKVLFESIGEQVDPEPSFFGLRTWGCDGVEFIVPDTPDNEEAFGRHSGSRGDAGFPHMKAVPLLDTTTRRIKDVVLGRYKLPERKACQQLLRHLGERDLLFADIGFAAVWLFEECLKRRIHFLMRISSQWKPKKLVELDDGDWLVEVTARVLLPPKQQTRKKKKTRKVTLKLRMIEYKIGKDEEVRLLTDLLDPCTYPARELALGYHIRWETEITNDEFKTHLSTVTHGTLHTTFRSKNRKGVIQEAYATLIAYNLIRELMMEAGELHNIRPLDISFVESVKVINLALPQFQEASPELQLRLSERLLCDIAACPIDRPRRKRCYSRCVKVKMSPFLLKRPADQEEKRDFRAELRLISTDSLRQQVH
jgi:hypothetical protein